MKVRYIGEKLTRKIQLPVPYLTKSETGDMVTFAGKDDVQDLPDQSAVNLVTICASEFELVEEKAAKAAKS